MFAASKTASVAIAGYQISRSLRFNSADSAYLTRGFSSGNRKTFTWSAWIKKTTLDVNNTIYSAETNTSNQFWIAFGSANTLVVFDYQGAYNLSLTSTPLYRDFSAWYHIVVAVDTTQATSTNRAKVYVNGLEITVTGSYPTQNYDTMVNNSASTAALGRSTGDGRYLNSYMTEVNFIDGQALTPSSFGETNAQTGVWQPKAYLGSYGTNGYYVNFSDNSNTTAATLGKDYSGNGNNWTPNNFSVTAGVGNDSMVDVPTPYGSDTGAGGEVRGNYATLNPLDKLSAVTAPLNGNLQYNTANSTGLMRGTLGVKSAKWYYEATITAVPSGGSIYIGVKDASDPTMTSSNGLGSNSGTTNEFGYAQSGYKQNNGTGTNIGTTLGAGDVLMVAYDLDGGYIWWGKNGTWISSGNPATGANPMFSTLTSTNGYSPSLGYNSIYTDGVVNFNFGQRPFAYTAPSGFQALCTQNLPTPTIGATTATLANKYFDATLYTGTGSTLAVTNAGGFQPDWVWLKNRSNVAYHSIWDAVRGRSAGGLASNDTGAEQASTAGNDFVSFNSNGFSVGPAQNWNVDTNGNTYVGWQWKANGSGSTNTAGTITSTVSANTTSGFSVVTYTGSGAAGTIGHGLGVAPSMIIVKSRSASGDWPVYHSTLGNSSNLVLNTTAATATSSTIWNATSPTSSVFSVGINTTSNTVTVTYVAYCFAPIAGFSSFGSYTANANADGPFIYTGFRPRWIMLKRSSNAGAPWSMFDTSRNTYNSTNLELDANASSAESTSGSGMDILSNGFKLRDSVYLNSSNGDTFIYVAFASNPFKYSLAR